MRLFGYRLSRTPKDGPNASLIEAIQPSLEQVCEILEAHTQDISTLNTAVNRIERKQNRWLEILNLRGEPPEDGEKPPVSVFRSNEWEPGGPQLGQEAGSTEQI
ncbi:hypothetical protein ES705_33268 [subsurface metagenome]